MQSFYDKWLVRLGERCKGHDQRQAAYYVWSRYSMSIGTLDSIANPHLIPDLSVICRGCLEFDVSLEAIIKYENVARDYLEFDKHAKARYLKILSKQGDIDRLLMRRKQFDETFGENPDDFGRNSWCAKYQGITGLINKLDRGVDLRLYSMLSHFAHGSVWAMHTLDKSINNPDKTLATMIEGVYTAYLNSTRSYVWFVWAPLTTPEGEQCKNDFLEVATAHIAEAT